MKASKQQIQANSRMCRQWNASATKGEEAFVLIGEVSKPRDCRTNCSPLGQDHRKQAAPPWGFRHSSRRHSVGLAWPWMACVT